jgi:hypothetical protein
MRTSLKDTTWYPNAADHPAPIDWPLQLRFADGYECEGSRRVLGWELRMPLGPAERAQTMRPTHWRRL